MKTDTPQTVYLKDYTQPAFWIDTVDLDFVIEAGGTTVTVTATLALRRNAERARRSRCAWTARTCTLARVLG